MLGNRFSLWFVIALPLLCSGGIGASDPAPKTPAPSPDACLRILEEGNRRFVWGVRQIPGSGDLRNRLAKDGQQPLAAVVACSDSREPVEYIFDQPIGGIFTIRTAGNTDGLQTRGSVQYAVRHLQVPLVIVMGHTQCGAVQAALSGQKEEGALADLIAPLTRIAQTAELAQSDNKQHDVCIANIRATLSALESEDSSLRRAIADGTTKLVGAIYDISTGEVSWLDHQ